jgi:phosphoribosylanthranilate isomerase
MSRTRVKICGITSPVDAAMAVTAGVDAIGLNFFSGSARYVAPAVAVEITGGLSPFVTRVGLFVNQDADEVSRILDEVELDLLQFHGQESAGYCESFNHAYIKAIPADSTEQIREAAGHYASAKGLLLDSPQKDQFGGSGKTFDWAIIPELEMPIILAGGLDPENVAEAIRQVRPHAVDLSGGVEIDKGVKDPVKMTAFMKAVRSVD